MTIIEKFRALDESIRVEHEKTVSTGWFQATVEKTLVNYSEKCSHETDPVAGFWKVQGAFEFLRCFCELSLPKTTAIRKDFDNLK